MPQSTRENLDVLHQWMLGRITGMRVSQTVLAAAALSLADHLADRPRTAAEIAQAEHADPRAMARLLRACVPLGLVRYDEMSSTSTAKPLLDTLNGPSSHSLNDLALSQTAPGHWLTWRRLTDAVRGDENPVSTTASSSTRPGCWRW